MVPLFPLQGMIMITYIILIQTMPSISSSLIKHNLESVSQMTTNDSPVLFPVHAVALIIPVNSLLKEMLHLMTLKRQWPGFVLSGLWGKVCTAGAFQHLLQTFFFEENIGESCTPNYFYENQSFQPFKFF